MIRPITGYEGPETEQSYNTGVSHTKYHLTVDVMEYKLFWSIQQNCKNYLEGMVEHQILPD